MPERFVDNSDGTVCDSETGLMWERKNQTIQGEDVHDILNGYTWTAEGDDFNIPTGTVFTDFLGRLNYFRFAAYSD